MLSEWRDDGLDASQVELWSVGYSGSTEQQITDYVNNSYIDPKPATSACFVDTDWSVYWAFSPSKDDVWVIDKGGDVAYFTNAAAMSLYSEPWRGQLDSAVRAAVAAP